MNSRDLIIRPLRENDIDQAVIIHTTAFPNYFLTYLGPKFLRLLYKFHIVEDESVANAGIYSDKIIGTLLGTTKPKQFYKRLATKYCLQFALASFIPFVRNPRILPRLIRALSYRGHYPSIDGNGALLASVCVDPSYQGMGFGKQLVFSFEKEMFSRGLKFLYLVTDRFNNERTLIFYKKMGWSELEAFRTPEGREMVILCKLNDWSLPQAGAAAGGVSPGGSAAD